VAITTLPIGLNKQAYQDASWHTGLDAGFDEANTRLTLSGVATPEGSVIGRFKGQHFFRTDTKQVYRFNGTLNTNTGWVLQEMDASQVVASGAYATVQAAITAMDLARKYAFQNAFVNGSCLISQRNPSESASGTVAAGLDVFVLDRIFIMPIGGTVSWARGGGNLPNGAVSPLGLELTGAAGITNVRVGSRFGREWCRRMGALLASKNITFGVKVKHFGTTGLITPDFVVRTTNHTGADSVGTKFAAANMTLRDTYAFAAPLGAGDSVSYTKTFDLGALTDGQNGIEVYVDLKAMNAATIKFCVTDFWIAFEDISSVLQCDRFQEELQRCEEFCQKSYNYENAPGSTAGGFSGAVTAMMTGGEAVTTWHFNRRMRGTPTVTMYNPSSGATNSWRDLDAAVDRPGAVFAAGESGAIFTGDDVGTHQLGAHGYADAEWYD
jgi:hypothetical protein